MKKTSIAILALAFIAFGASAQELTSKKGEAYLPEEGDWALGIDATPFFTYFGNFFTSAANTAPSFSFVDNSMTVYGKMFKDANTAYRARLRFLGMHNDATIASISDQASADPNATVEDKRVVSTFATTVGVGMEKRRGNTRLQGFYGGEVLITYGSSGTKYDYGNALSSTNQAPPSTDFGDGNLSGPRGGYRVTEVNGSDFYYVGVRPFIGVEYFILPKISFSGEFGYTVAYGGVISQETTEEYWDNASNSVQTLVTKSNGEGNVILDNDNLSGIMKILFHF